MIKHDLLDSSEDEREGASGQLEKEDVKIHIKKEEEALRINETFARRYEETKDKEELKALSTVGKNRWGRPEYRQFASGVGSADTATPGDNDDGSGSSSSDDEDSEAELLTHEVEEKILTTITKIRRKDPEVYESSKVFFTDEDFASVDAAREGNSVKKERLTYGKFLSSTLKKEGAEAFNESDSDNEESPGLCNRAAPVGQSYEDEQHSLKKAFWEAAENDAYEDEDDLLVKREKTAAERDEEQHSFKEFLKHRAVDKAGDESKLLAHYFGTDDTLTPADKFLRDYILYEGWKEGSTMPAHLVDSVGEEHPAPFEEKEDEVEQAELFENVYNFRFEETAAGAPLLEGHTRKVLDSVRRKDTTRQQKRLQRKLRKEQEKQALKEEVKRAQALKRKEVMKRLQAIQEIAGLGSANQLDESVVDLEGDFDENEHERQMEALFGESFEEAEETVGEEEILQTPAPLESVVEDVSKKLSKKQLKNLEKLKKKKAKLEKLMQEDDGMPYAPDGADGGAEDSGDLNENAYPEGPAMEVQDEGLGNVEGEDAVEADGEDGTGTHTNAEIEPTPLWWLCDGCSQGIKAGKKRHDCLVCENFTLCKKCHRCVRHPHRLVAKRVPLNCPPPEDITTTAGSMTTVDEQMKAEIEKYLDEIDAMDFEDVIGGDLPTRFKYTNVQKHSYGMTTEEILNLEDRQLNQRISLKKLAPYRPKDRHSEKRRNAQYPPSWKKPKLHHKPDRKQE